MQLKGRIKIQLILIKINLKRKLHICNKETISTPYLIISHYSIKNKLLKYTYT